MQRLARPDGDLGYRDSGAGPALTLLHGFTQDGRVWEEFAAALGAGRRLVRPDLRGHGASRFPAGADHGAAACGADLMALWDHLGIERSDLLGYSMGGRLALQLALERPQRLRSLVLVSAQAGLEADAAGARRRSDARLAARIQERGLPDFLDSWMAQPLLAGIRRRGAERVEAERRARLEGDPAGLAASLRDLGAGTMPSLWARLPGLRLPTLVVVGAEDQRYLELGRRLVSLLPQSRLARVEDAGHGVPLEQPERLAELVRAFLAGPPA